MKAGRFALLPNRGVGHACPWCDVVMTRPEGLSLRQTDATLDHVIPRCRIGSHGPKLFVCWQCNQIKGDLTLDEFAAKIAFPRLWQTVARRGRRAGVAGAGARSGMGGLVPGLRHFGQPSGLALIFEPVPLPLGAPQGPGRAHGGKLGFFRANPLDKPKGGEAPATYRVLRFPEAAA